MLKNNINSFRDPSMQGLHEASAQIVLLSPLKLGLNGLKLTFIASHNPAAQSANNCELKGNYMRGRGAWSVIYLIKQ